MFLFQMEYNSDSNPENSRFGMRNRKRSFSEEAAQSLSVIVDGVAAEMLSPSKVTRDKAVEDFASTLTPGAQNAIHAASFAWGYENAMKYVKNAMKLDEVKNADNDVEKSKAVIESMTVQAGQNEQSETVSKFVWGYYNEDLKDTQAQAGKTETITGKNRDAEKEKEQEQQRIQMPLSAPEAVASSICLGTLSPSLLYCADAQQGVAVMQEERAAEQKREELSRLVSPQGAAQKVRASGAAAAGAGAASASVEMLDDSAKLALARQDEQAREFMQVEKQLNTAIKTLDKFSEDEADKAKKIAAMLPGELSRYILLHEKALSKKRALRAQLSKWMAFSRSGGKALAGMPSSKLIKLAALSSFLRGK